MTDTHELALVDVVIPLHNKAHVVSRAVRSVFAQDLTQWRMIIVDDGSTDAWQSTLAPYLSDARVTLLRQPNQGPGAARNRGAAASDSPYIAFLDADDEWAPTYLTTLVGHLRDCPADSAVSTLWDYDVPDADIRRRYLAVGLRFGRWTLSDGFSPEQLKLRIDSLHTSATVVRRSVFTDLDGFYDADFCTYGEDSFLWARLVFSGRSLSTLDRRLMVLHRDASALSFGRDSPFPLPPVLSHWRVVLGEVPPRNRVIVKRYLRHWAWFVAKRAVREGALGVFGSAAAVLATLALTRQSEAVG